MVASVRLEVEDWADDAGDGDGVAYVGDDFGGRLVDHRGFVSGEIGDGLGVDALHGLLEILHSDGLVSFGAAHDSSGPVRCRAVPVGIALAYANQ